MWSIVFVQSSNCRHGASWHGVPVTCIATGSQVYCFRSTRPKRTLTWSINSISKELLRGAGMRNGPRTTGGLQDIPDYTGRLAARWRQSAGCYATCQCRHMQHQQQHLSVGPQDAPESKPQTSVHNFAKYWPIFSILSLTHFISHIIATFPLNVSVKQFLKAVNNWRRHGQKFLRRLSDVRFAHAAIGCKKVYMRLSHWTNWKCSKMWLANDYK